MHIIDDYQLKFMVLELCRHRHAKKKIDVDNYPLGIVGLGRSIGSPLYHGRYGFVKNGDSF